MSNLDKLLALMIQLKPELDAIYDADATKRKVLSSVCDLVKNFDASDTEDIDQIRDRITDLASDLDHTWTGDDYGYSWTIGQPIQFWIPSNC